MPKYYVKHRRGTSDQWDKSDIVLLDGEIAIEDTGDGYKAFIIGDGTNTYHNLPRLYLREAKTRKITVNLPVDAWEGDKSPYSQVIHVDDITDKSKIDLQPTEEQIAQLQNEGISLTAANVDGKKVVVYAICAKKPTVAYTIQATIVEIT